MRLYYTMMTDNELSRLAHQAITLAAECDLPIRIIAEYLLDGYTPEQITAALVIAEECNVPLDTALYDYANTKTKADEPQMIHPRVIVGYEDF